MAVETKIIAKDQIGNPNLDLREVGLVLEHPKIDLITYPYEWSFSALKAAALLHIEVQLAALKHGITLSDASAYNIQFEGVKPVFIDIMSFRKYQESEMWVGHQQFCEQFLNPLLLRAYGGVSHNAWYRGNLEGVPSDALLKILKLRKKLKLYSLIHLVLPNWFQNSPSAVGNPRKRKGTINRSTIVYLLTTLRKWISSLTVSGNEISAWHQYEKKNTYSEQGKIIKKQFLARFIHRYKPRVLWDMGCNQGQYSQVALENGAQRSYGWDSDLLALETAFQRAQTNRLRFLPLYLDAANPSPNQGWRQEERSGIQERSNADAVIALAFIHHLVIAKNIPMNEAINFIVNLAPKGIVEFVPKTDPTVRFMLKNREDIFFAYTEENFMKILQREARIVDQQCISNSQRKLIIFERD